MEIQLDTQAESVALDETLTRLTLAAAALEAVATRFATFDLEAAQSREQTLTAQLAEAEATIRQLQAAAGARKTNAPGTLVAREGLALEAHALDAALTSLSMEQRIAVKAHLLRAGLLT